MKYKLHRVRALVIVGTAAIIGAGWLIVSHAATPYASINADKGTLTCGASVSADSTASDGNKVVFSNCSLHPYYVDCSSGSDSSAGTTEATAWKTLSKVSDTTFAAGSTIYLDRGCSWDGGMSLNGTGTASQPIVVDAYGSGNAPIVENSTGALYTFAIKMNGAYQTVQHLFVNDGTEAGIGLEATHETVNDNEITDSGNGVETNSSATYATMEYNDVHDLKMAYNVEGGDSDYGAVGFNLGANDNNVAYNTCLNCEAPSDDFGTDGGFVEIYNNGQNDNIHNNLAENDDGFLEVGGGTNETNADNIIVDYNVMIDTGDAANLHSGSSFAIPATLKFDNNTFYDTATTGVVFDVPTSELTSVQNNIFYVGHGIYSTPETHTNNIYDMLSGAAVGYTLTLTEKSVNPLFVSPTTGNFNLQSGSPAIGAGVNLGFTSDYAGSTVTSPPDIGAYQYK